MTFRVVDGVSRRVARKMLRRIGLPTEDVHRMSYAALAAALTERGCDVDVFDRMVAEWRATPGPWTKGYRPTPDARPAPAPVPSPVPVPDESREAAENALRGALPDRPTPDRPTSPGTVDAAIADLVKAMTPKAPVVDPEAIRAMVESAVSAAVADRIPQTIKVEYAGVTRDVGGFKHPRFEDVLRALSAKLHVWLPGPAGSGKSTLAVQCGEALGYTLAAADDPVDAPRRIYVQGAVETSFGYSGYTSANGDRSTLYTALRRAWQFGGVLILDDTDRSSAKALAWLNMPLANGHCQFPDGLVAKHPDCLIVATANTYGLGGGADYVGAGRLDKATLDRFVFLDVPYDERVERAIAGPDAADWCAHVQAVRSAVRRLGEKHLVTPRATFKGAALLAAGMKRADVEAAVLYAGLSAETVQRVKGAL